MTALPAYVQSALSIDGLSLSDAMDPDVIARILAPEPELSDLEYVISQHWSGQCRLAYTITSKDARDALTLNTSLYYRHPYWRGWWTCPKCPQPLYTPPEVYGYLRRCTQCNTYTQTRRRMNRLLDDIVLVEQVLEKRTRWVTLTVPNEPDLYDGIKNLKERLSRFYRTKSFKQKVVANVDFFEATWSPEHQDWNVHVHSLWTGDYWAQSDLLTSWQAYGRGGARIESTGNRQKRLNYCIHYSKKQKIQGIRAQQRRGCLYGSALADVKSLAMLLSEFGTAPVVLE